jgi:hypothetical protein
MRRPGSVRTVLPVVILAVVAVPLVIIAALTVRRSKAAGEHPPTEDAAAQARIEQEFEEAERYQEEWRAAQHREHGPGV